MSKRRRAKSSTVGSRRGGGRPRIGLFGLFCACVLALGASFALAAPAFAGTVETGIFGGGGPGEGGSGSGNGQLSDPGQVAVNDASGEIYIVDAGNNRLEAFTPTATAAEYEAQVAVTAPTGVAIDQQTGDVYVAGASGIVKFDEDLNPITSGWTGPAVSGELAVDPTTGDLLVADQVDNLVRRYESDGTAAGSFAAERPIGIAANSAGEIFVVTSTGDVTLECPSSGATSSVRRFSAAGVAEGTIGASLEAPGAVAVDPDDDAISVVAAVNQYNCEPFEGPHLVTFAADGTEESDQPLQEANYSTSEGVAAQGGSARSYVVVKSPANDFYAQTKVVVFDDAAPTVHTIPAFALGGGTKALLGGRVNPEDQPTTYWFEYGRNDSYGTSVPAGEDASAGSGTHTVTFSQQANGLIPNTTYHYRIAARNGTGTTFGDDMIFTTGTDAGPPQESCANAELRALQGATVTTECRGWEMVSPLGKNNLDAGGSEASLSPVAPSVSGNQAMFFADGAFGDAQSGSTGNAYLATRNAEGWSTHGLVPPLQVTSAFGNHAPFEKVLSPDLSKSMIQSPTPLTADSPKGVPNLYVRNNVTEEYELVTVSAPTNAPSAFATAPFVAAVTPDFKRVIFYSPYKYTADAPEGGSSLLLYEWRSGDPELTLVGKLPDNSAAPGVYLGGESNNAFSGSSYRAFSADGSRVYFNAPSTEGTYLREGGVTKEVSPHGTFWEASPDGSRALLIVNGVLERYDAATETLTDISPDNEPSDGSEPQVQGLLGASDDLSVVYFTASRYLVPGGDEFDWHTGETGLYVSDNGVVSQIGTIGSSTDSEGAEAAYESGLASNFGGYPLKANREVSPSGGLLVFASARRLTAYDNATHSEVYLYDNATKQLSCISCRPDGTPAVANAVLEGTVKPHSSLVSVGIEFPRHNISAGGSRIFFTSGDAIAPEDTDGTSDVYEWQNGRDTLVTPGVGGDREGYVFKGATPSGSDVFFATRNQVVGVDTDRLTDIYDARVEGGFASQLAATAVAPCEGEQCRGAASAAPPSSSPASQEIRGAQNAKPKKHKKHHGKKGKKHHKKGKHKKHHGKKGKHKKPAHRSQRNG